MNLYSVNAKIDATVYVKARNKREARRLAKEFMVNAPFEFTGDDVSSREYSDPELPDVSLSPAMTGVGIYGIADTELVEENIPEDD